MRIKGKGAALNACLLAGCLAAGCSTHPALKPEVSQDAIRQALEQPAKRPGAVPEAISQALLPPLPEALPPPRSLEPRFDLAVNAAPAAQVLLAIVSGTRYSMLLPPDLGGSLTLNLKNVTVREALESIRELYGYEFSVQGTRITIHPNTLQTRLFQISYLAGKRGGGSATRVTASNVFPAGGATSTTGAAAGGAGVAPEATTVYTGQSSDFWFDLAQALAIALNCEYEVQRANVAAQSGISPAAAGMAQALSQRMDKLKCADGRNFVVNPQSGVVMVRAMPAELRDVGRMLKAMQASVERQVMIEAKIIEVELSDDFQSGINWQALDSYGRPRWSVNAQTDNIGAFPPSVSDVATLTGSLGLLKSFSVGGALGLAFQTGSFASLIQFLKTQGSVQVMSSPRIATLNNQKAVLKVGSDDYYVTAVTPPSYSTTGTNSSIGGSSTSVNPPTITTQPFFSGVSLDVTPQVDDGGSITLHIRPAISEVSEKEKVINFGTLGTYSLPYASSKVKEADSIVRVRDGMIVAIGGLMSQAQSDQNARVPGAGDVPVIGQFFKQANVARAKRELVILLKPTVIREEADWERDLDATRERLRDYDPGRGRQPAALMP